MEKKTRQYYPKISTQLFIQLLIIACTVTSILMIFNSQLITNLYMQRSRNRLIDTAEYLDKIDYSSNDFINKIFAWEDDHVNLYIEVFNKNHSIVYSSMLYNLSVGSKISNEKNYSLIKSRTLTVVSTDIVENGYTFYTCCEEDDKREFIVLTTTLKDGKFVKLYLQKDTIESTARFFRLMIDIISILFTAIFSIVLLIYSRLFVSPIVKISKITEKMAKMDFSEKCKVQRNNELGSLAKNINHLSDSLDKTLSELKDKNVQLEKDIEYERRLEQSRRDFVSNVSHELKTPIAVLKGYAEGLLYNIKNDKESQEEYCRIIIDETNRMNKLVIDLLNLSQLNSGKYVLDKQSFSIHKFISESVYAHYMIFKDENIHIEVAIDESFMGFGDISKLDLVINNYLSNAISHCQNERIVRITSKEMDNAYRVSVYNSGKQISDKHLNEIWNNFYRCDESHKRDDTHFGIGLSITKAIQDLHGMKFGAENKPDGVEFWFDIQKYKKT